MASSWCLASSLGASCLPHIFFPSLHSYQHYLHLSLSLSYQITGRNCPCTIERSLATNTAIAMPVGNLHSLLYRLLARMVFLTDDELRRGARRGAEAALDEFGSGSHRSVGSRPGQGPEAFSSLLSSPFVLHVAETQFPVISSNCEAHMHVKGNIYAIRHVAEWVKSINVKGRFIGVALTKSGEKMLGRSPEELDDIVGYLESQGVRRDWMGYIMSQCLLLCLGLSGHASPVESVTFNSAEVLVLAGASVGVVKLWDLEETKSLTRATHFLISMTSLCGGIHTISTNRKKNNIHLLSEG
ncbi:hypothetical protein RHMOL_Rhmol09G0135800 [Rhododendron molle]|uniref:Uncharacterized protein n=1 Tax=Rhododendron molle TaxID=49168 RepID=A0ACC0ME60_RHOML|nr:hypothetical protein RHMOL_Rhmol09G0135800 [Rhododendron molle]